MNPDLILQANMLDIIFENRNKEYGAYELRTRYNKRLKKAMSIILITTITLCAFAYVDNKFFHNKNNVPIISFTNDSLVSIKTADLKKPQIKKPKMSSPAERNIATIKNPTPLIVADKFVIKPIATAEELQQKEIGTETKPGELSTNVATVAANGNEKGNSTEKTNEAPPILETAEFMPEFPGGMEAMRKFLNKNIRMPKDDIEPGTKIRVLEKFVVDEEGNISSIQIIQSGGAEFDNEVIRVLKKMPKWKPGKQNGRNVAVYFNIPVIFESHDDN